MYPIPISSVVFLLPTTFFVLRIICPRPWYSVTSYVSFGCHLIVFFFIKIIFFGEVDVELLG